MIKPRRRAMLLLGFILAGNLQGFALSPVELEFGAGTAQNHNRGFYYFWSVNSFFSAEFDESLMLYCAATLGQRAGIFDLGSTLSVEYGLPFLRPYVPLFLKSAYLYQGLPAWETHIHTLISTAALKWKRAGFSLGYTLRWTNFTTGPVLFEPVIAYMAYLTFFKAGDTVIGARISNFGDSYADNLASFHVALDNEFELGKRIRITCGFEVLLSGNVGHIVSVYGVSFREGIIFKW
ncbi:MAG: hypothetical protein LBQ35_02365 [Spirochaetaceae bacterium]|jgi:hypothetical protein|nr:hypothetical protein [Spirochaetaceae bacterium]